MRNFFHFQETPDHDLLTRDSLGTSQERFDQEKLPLERVFFEVRLSICEHPNKKMERERRKNIFI